MPTGAENLQTALDRTRQHIADMLADPLDARFPFKPDYAIDGQSVTRSAYLKSLFDAEERLVEALRRAEGPFEVNQQGWT